MTDCPNLVSEMCTPKVFWHQTDWSVGLRIMLCGVDDYFLFVDNDHLRFSTICNDRKYYLCIYLFGAIIPEKCTHTNVGREIRINLFKGHKWTMWPRLCLDTTKDPQIKVDPDKLNIKDKDDKGLPAIASEWFKKKQREVEEKTKFANVMPDAAVSSDEAESEDEMNDALFDE